MPKIKEIKASEILDSRGNPTVCVKVITESGIVGEARIPSGASTGSREALELRDGEKRYMGKGVLKAVFNVNNIISPKIMGMSVFDHLVIDDLMLELDGTENKSDLGANAILGVSLAVLKAAAKYAGKELYDYLGDDFSMPEATMNILNGGAHADNNLEIQEFMIITKNEYFKERLRMASEIFHNLKKILKEKGDITSVGDEGGFAPNLESNFEAFDLIIEAIVKAGYEPGKDVTLGMDVAASSFYDKEKRKYLIDKKELSTDEMIDYLVSIVDKYPIEILEDGLDENDWSGFKKLTQKIGDRVELVGDDLFVTNKKLLQKGIDEGVCNAILIKANQIGSVKETLETIMLAKENGYKTIISHRSGETTDTFIADFAVGLNLGQIKTGSLSRGERICKYNRLLEIEEEISWLSLLLYLRFFNVIIEHIIYSLEDNVAKNTDSFYLNKKNCGNLYWLLLNEKEVMLISFKGAKDSFFVGLSNISDNKKTKMALSKDIDSSNIIKEAKKRYEDFKDKGRWYNSSTTLVVRVVDDKPSIVLGEIRVSARGDFGSIGVSLSQKKRNELSLRHLSSFENLGSAYIR